MGFSVAPSQAPTFVLAGRHAECQSLRLAYDALLKKGVIVRPFGNLPTSLRITLGKPAENDRFLRALGEVVA